MFLITRFIYGRTATEQIKGEQRRKHWVKKKEYDVYSGVHEGIISEEDWKTAQQKRLDMGGKFEKKHSLEHEHILSGILKCPVCGAPMYGNVNRKKKKDGTIYKDHFYYTCKHRLVSEGKQCNYSKQWNQERVNTTVESLIKGIVNNKKFEDAIL